jgi:hypothetical protein
MATWHDVRAMRASPPGYASSGQRRKTFGSALQQAEELATAAEHAGYSTKPILLFYALAQAYRAICAAHLKGDWQPTGHGVAVPNRGSAVLDVAVKNDGAGLYQAAMSVAKEAPLAGEVTLGALWASNPELRHQAPAEVLSLPGALTLHRQYPPPTDPSAPDDALFMTVDGLTEVADAAAFSAALADYPSLSQAQPATYPTGVQIGALSAEVDRNGVAFPSLLTSGHGSGRSWSWREHRSCRTVHQPKSSSGRRQVVAKPARNRNARQGAAEGGMSRLHALRAGQRTHEPTGLLRPSPMPVDQSRNGVKERASRAEQTRCNLVRRVGPPEVIGRSNSSPRTTKPVGVQSLAGVRPVGVLGVRRRWR